MRSAELLKKYNIRLKKSLGQNLLLDANINRKMADVAEIGPADSVIEVGAGIGDLTEVLADRAGTVLAIEIDRTFERPLQERFEHNRRVKIVLGDILDHPVRELADRHLPDSKTLKMVSNLPFYITSPVLMHFLESDAKIVSLTAIIQREVAERIVAAPGGKEYGLLSIACQLYARPYIVHVVSPNCFRPRPKVESAIVHFPLHGDTGLSHEERLVFFRIVNAAFGQRRKKVINALAVLSGSLLPDRDPLQQLLEQTGIHPDSRAETISIQCFTALAKRVARERPPPG